MGAPESMTATATGEPVEMAHASGASMSVSGVAWLEAPGAEDRGEALERLPGVVQAPLLVEIVVTSVPGL